MVDVIYRVSLVGRLSPILSFFLPEKIFQRILSEVCARKNNNKIDNRVVARSRESVRFNMQVFDRYVPYFFGEMNHQTRVRHKRSQTNFRAVLLCEVHEIFNKVHFVKS